MADLTYVATWRGFVYVAFVIDVFSRRIVGVNKHPKFPTCRHRKFPTPVHSVASAGRTRPALSLSFSRYELPRMFRVMA